MWPEKHEVGTFPFQSWGSEQRAWRALLPNSASVNRRSGCSSAMTLTHSRSPSAYLSILDPRTRPLVLYPRTPIPTHPTSPLTADRGRGVGWVGATPGPQCSDYFRTQRDSCNEWEILRACVWLTGHSVTALDTVISLWCMHVAALPVCAESSQVWETLTGVSVVYS